MQSSSLSFDRGSVVVRGELRIPNTSYDERIHAFRAQGLYYRDITEYLKRSKLLTNDKVQQLVPCPNIACPSVKLRGYQKDALKAWDKGGRRGSIVLPTGAGKTVIALKAIELVNESSLVVVPTLDLLEQWRKRIEKDLNLEVGVCGGGDF
ncbi:MAG: DEAD/DEAH box helicase family protein, partial [Thaumarchaeota archaeon]|nr:DEAD/DEAH box helicase family protein [Nitrososphaerota archaeon]